MTDVATDPFESFPLDMGPSHDESTLILSMPTMPHRRGRIRVALVAHDAKKPDLVAWVAEHRVSLAEFDLLATGTTGHQIMQRCPGLDVHRLRSGPLGGDQQLGALIVEGQLHALIFFMDPLSALAHDSDVKALLRIAAVVDIPCALNRASAELMLPALSEMARERMNSIGVKSERAKVTPRQPVGDGHGRPEVVNNSSATSEPETP